MVAGSPIDSADRVLLHSLELATTHPLCLSIANRRLLSNPAYDPANLDRCLCRNSCLNRDLRGHDRSAQAPCRRPLALLSVP